MLVGSRAKYTISIRIAMNIRDILLVLSWHRQFQSCCQEVYTATPSALSTCTSVISSSSGIDLVRYEPQKSTYVVIIKPPTHTHTHTIPCNVYSNYGYIGVVKSTCSFYKSSTYPPPPSCSGVSGRAGPEAAAKGPQ